ncbi:hypothetical protein KIN20_019689 [Parelaphostrongylus tenuis]|uniref:Uncharacterized protein n=1 Tax=Parelaphostrongylus tenuis TaxID=148309 RepID=A0AAD5N8Z9_PARTN|nr:hypothetical protein KIN20_019689 [Parelaphostrongylus tenuis]
MLLQRYESSHAQILKGYKADGRIFKLHNDWQPLLDSSSDEKDNLGHFITTHGYYRETIGTSVTLLENLAPSLNSLDSELSKRGLQTLYDASDKASKRNVALAPEDPQPAASSTMTVNRNSPSLLNFVDTSILSKLELSSFVGYLLNYPEFSARFATLVDNKKQSDDTTKSSLLKSCLRGKALSSIQRLAITPDIARKEAAMDAMESAFPSSAVETERYDFMVAANSAHLFAGTENLQELQYSKSHNSKQAVQCVRARA